MQKLFWQMGGLAPMAGQNHHFGQTAAIVQKELA
jgi:GST-like protein